MQYKVLPTCNLQYQQFDVEMNGDVDIPLGFIHVRSERENLHAGRPTQRYPSCTVKQGNFLSDIPSLALTTRAPVKDIREAGGTCQ